MKFKLLPYWKSAWRFTSVQLGLIGTAITTFFIASPDAILQTWLILPDVFKQAIPPRYIPMIGVAIMVLGTISRIIAQPKTQQIVDQKMVEKKVT